VVVVLLLTVFDRKKHFYTSRYRTGQTRQKCGYVPIVRVDVAVITGCTTGLACVGINLTMYQLRRMK
jgi:hypothetical protein